MQQITTNYFVAAQISTGDVQEIVQAGFKAVICNRPDSEVPPSHQSAALENAARASGLEFYTLPLTHQTMTTEIVSQQMALSRLTGPANILVVPARHSASISVKLMQEMGDATVIGPILAGVDESIQVCSTSATANDILNMAILAACKVG